MSVSPSRPNHVFVYGTLKRGQCREKCWPRAALRVDEGTIRAALYDLGPYPAVGPGDDCIVGEAWELAASDLEPTLDALDEVEGYSGDEAGAGNLYVRRMVEVELFNGRRVAAWTYFLADEQKLVAFERVSPERDGLCRWSAGC
jgi:gamma-glutamylcyclotransferase (GGCT)/AIG2-like uncharacterized protein YtfP